MIILLLEYQHISIYTKQLMRLIQTITDKEIFNKNYDIFSRNWHLRHAARAILMDNESKIALLNVTDKNYYKLPGGGIDYGESTTEALERELLEETGCKSMILGEVGQITEYRYFPNDPSNGLIHTSFCYYTHLQGEKGTPKMTQKEIDDGFKLEWHQVEQAVNLIKNSSPKDYTGKFIIERDSSFIESFQSQTNLS